MPTARPITALEIIAYANRLADTMLPAVVPPVFRVKGDASSVLLPPFTLRDWMLHDAAQITLRRWIRGTDGESPRSRRRFSCRPPNAGNREDQTGGSLIP